MEIAAKAGRISRALPWQIGDLAFYADVEYSGEVTLPDMGLIFGLDEATVSIYRNAAGRFSHDRRRPRLSFSHHALLFSWGSDGEQDEWLDRAEEAGWSRDELEASPSPHRLTPPNRGHRRS